MKRRYLLVAALALGLTSLAADASAQQRLDPRKNNPVFAGYLEVAFTNAARGLTGAKSPAAYNVINYSFCTPSPVGSANITLQSSAAFATRQDLINDVKAVIAQGGIAQCSLGGANSDVLLDTPQKIGTFVSSLNALYDEVPFNGIDIDLEGASFRLDANDRDFRNPTTPALKNFITALRMFVDARKAKDPGFYLTMAPETFFVQAGLQKYGPTDIGIPAGAALPIIEAFRNDLGAIYVQNYNSGAMLGLDKVAYSTATVEFLVSQQELLLQGFPVGGTPFVFQPLKEQQVAIGLPANQQSAGSGFASPQIVMQALSYLTKGQAAKSGTYTLVKASGYPNFGGIMAFSINQDVGNSGSGFSNALGPFLKTLRSGASTTAEVAR